MDWLRIGAFALLILYHIGMVFVPWNFHVKSLHVEDWATLPMLATNAWRLTLLFVVSGYASRALLRRSTGVGAFFGNRCFRLLVPLVFGIAVIVPPQCWVELVTKHGYAGSYLTFWTHDYFRFGTLGGIALPTWNHLWFVVYLWVYTAALTLGIAIVRVPILQAAFDRVFGGWLVLVLPVAWLVFVHGWWFQMAAETQALVGDWVAHVTYFPAFLFGFGLAGSDAAMAAIGRWWKVAGVAAILGYAVILGVELHWPGDIQAPRWVYTPYGIAHAVEQWGAIVALIGIAERHWNRDHPWRPMLTEAVFPFYLIHQTIIVLVMYSLLPAGLPGWVEFACLLAATVIGCAAFYRIGRAIAPLRPLIGLRPSPSPHAEETRMTHWTLVIHGGAGKLDPATLSPEQDAGAHAGLSRALDAGGAVLAAGGSAVDAVEAAVRVLEDDPHFNAGRGAVFTHEGGIELDAAIMDGSRAAGAVAAVSATRNPVRLARAVMDDGRHVFLAGKGADAFSVKQRLDQAGPDWFATDERRRQFAELQASGDGFDVDMKYGTVGAVACDMRGHVAAATSTGGVTGKRWGRIGDSPVIGAGTWADDRACAVSCTGSGEYFLRVGVGHEIAARVRLTGETLQAATDAVLAEVKALGGTGGAIVVGPGGDMAWSFNTVGMYRGHAASTGARGVAIYATERA